MLSLTLRASVRAVASTSRTPALLASSSRRAASNLPSRPPAQPTVLLSSPSAEQLAQEEIDVEPLPSEQAQIILTDRAAEQLRTMSARQADPNAALRIAVESGGCHGYQYKMDLAKTQALDDYHFSHPTVKPSNILVDAISLSLLNGSTVDYATELIGSSFRVLDNPHAKGSGCGCGVSWELKT